MSKHYMNNGGEECHPYENINNIQLRTIYDLPVLNRKVENNYYDHVDRSQSKKK
jgi:hypothetical protein